MYSSHSSLDTHLRSQRGSIERFLNKELDRNFREMQSKIQQKKSTEKPTVEEPATVVMVVVTHRRRRGEAHRGGGLDDDVVVQALMWSAMDIIILNLL